MNALEIIIAITAAIEAGLTLALVFRPTEPETEHPHFVARSTKFYRSEQGADGTWHIE
jgi:hypothetical protein